MRDRVTHALGRYRQTFTGFTPGQKAVAVVGTAALLLGGFLVFRWASTPAMAPLFSNMSAEDASAVIDQLDAQGVPYEITNSGATVMVPKDQVYETRIALSGEGLPSSSDGGYSILDDQDLTTSQFQEQTDFKRAMEGELSRTVEALDGVDTAVVHLALPERKVFAEEQDPATASVLVRTRPGTTLEQEQVQAVVHLVASSIDGLDPSDVTVADATGRVLSTPDGEGGAASTRAQQVADFQNEINSKLQGTLDRVLGPGNSTVQVTANLDFDKAVTESRTYEADPDAPPLSSSTQTEKYTGPGGSGVGGGVGGVVGPDGQMEPGAGTDGEGSDYEKSSVTEDNAVNTTVERRESAPGSVESLHVGVVLDARTAGAIDPEEVRSLVMATIGANRARGDTVRVSSMPFDRSLEEATAAELAKAEAADKKAERNALYRNLALVGLVVLLVVAAWWRERRKAKARKQATTYVVEQLREEASARAAAQPEIETPPAVLALEQGEHNATEELREELAALVERQPEDVAALLRGWLVDRP